MAHSRRRKTQKGSGIFTRFRNFVTGRKSDQVPQPIPGRNVGFRNANSAVLVNSPMQQIILNDDGEFDRIMGRAPASVANSAPANEGTPSFLLASPLAPAVDPAPLQVPPLTNPPPIAAVTLILNSFYRLLNQSQALQNDYDLQLTEYPEPPDGQFRHPILDELSFDPITKQQNTSYFTIIDHIKEFDANYAAKLGPEINSGTYGTIYKHATVQNRIIKQMKKRAGQTIEDFLKNSIRETFIQFYLAIGVPGAVPPIFSFAKEIVDEDNVSFYVEMFYLRPNKGYRDLLSFLKYRDNTTPSKTLTFDRFKNIVTKVCNRLIQLQDFAGLVHRDFKENNMMINIVTDDIKIIDFGMSFIRVPGDYLLINQAGGYRADAAIRFQQDMGLFFIILRQFFLSGTKAGYPTYNNPQIRGFIESIIPRSISGLVNYLSAYNVNGSVYANANTEILTPRAVLTALNTFAATGRIRGGFGHRTKKRRRTYALT
jgi:hypothetical protein